MTDDDLFKAFAARIAPFLPASGGGQPPIITPPPVQPPPPPVQPPPQTAGISPRWTAAPSQWAKWYFVTAAETTALQARYDPAEVSRHIGWYQPGGVPLYGVHNPDGSYSYFDPDWPYYPAKQVPDQLGAADKMHAELCRRYNKAEIAPLG